MVSVASKVLPLSERRFFTWMALSMAAATFAGFAPTYYLVGLNSGPTPELTPRLHIHGVLATGWIVLLVAQTRLIAAGRRDLHQRLGILGVLLGVAVFVSGIFVAILSERRVHTEANAGTMADPYVFLVFAFASVGLFAFFATLGVLDRYRPDRHKRLMLLATMSLIIPALARIVTQILQGAGIVGVPGVIGAVMIVNVFLAALVIHDFATRGRLHPVTLWGGGFFLLSEPLRFVIGFSAPWQAFAKVLMG
jgi:hypothetical protein